MQKFTSPDITIVDLNIMDVITTSPDNESCWEDCPADTFGCDEEF